MLYPTSIAILLIGSVDSLRSFAAFSIRRLAIYTGSVCPVSLIKASLYNPLTDTPVLPEQNASIHRLNFLQYTFFNLAMVDSALSSVLCRLSIFFQTVSIRSIQPCSERVPKTHSLILLPVKQFFKCLIVVTQNFTSKSPICFTKRFKSDKYQLPLSHA